MPLHLELYVRGAAAGVKQPVEVEDLGGGKYEILFTPGLVEEVAAGDLIELLDSASGAFRVIARWGNLAVKWGAPGGHISDEAMEEAIKLLAPFEARLDGRIATAAVWTIPPPFVLSNVAQAMNKVVELVRGSGWWYGNVYDEKGEPWGWWVEPAEGKGYSADTALSAAPPIDYGAFG